VGNVTVITTPLAPRMRKAPQTEKLYNSAVDVARREEQTSYWLDARPGSRGSYKSGSI